VIYRDFKFPSVLVLLFACAYIFNRLGNKPHPAALLKYFPENSFFPLRVATIYTFDLSPDLQFDCNPGERSRHHIIIRRIFARAEDDPILKHKGSQQENFAFGMSFSSQSAIRNTLVAAADHLIKLATTEPLLTPYAMASQTESTKKRKLSEGLHGAGAGSRDALPAGNPALEENKFSK
jgi:hypothetical protein